MTSLQIYTTAQQLLRWATVATINMGQKQGADVPLSGGAVSPSNNVAWAEAYLRTKWHLDPSNRLATRHQRHRHAGQDRQTTVR